MRVAFTFIFESAYDLEETVLSWPEGGGSFACRAGARVFSETGFVEIHLDSCSCSFAAMPERGFYHVRGLAFPLVLTTHTDSMMGSYSIGRHPR